MKIIKLLALALLVLATGVLGGRLAVRKNQTQERIFEIKARKYAYLPGVIRVNRGDKITLKLSSVDVTHGFYLEGYDFDAKLDPETPGFLIRVPSTSRKFSAESVESYTFSADRVGKFRYRCSIGCGPMHPFMQGELIVAPNYLFPTSIGLAVGMVFAIIIYFSGKERRDRR